MIHTIVSQNYTKIFPFLLRVEEGALSQIQKACEKSGWVYGDYTHRKQESNLIPLRVQSLQFERKKNLQNDVPYCGLFQIQFFLVRPITGLKYNSGKYAEFADSNCGNRERYIYPFKVYKDKSTPA